MSSANTGADAPQKGGGCCSRRKKDDLSKYGMLPDDRRKCTDCFCLLVFLLFFAGAVAIGAYGIHVGKWQRLVYGTDYQGNTCGVDDPVKDMKYVVYPRTNEDFLVNLTKHPHEYTFYGICAASCPEKLDVVCNYDPSDLSDIDMIHKTQCMDGTNDPTDVIPGTSHTCQYVMDNCWILPEATSSVMFRCVPVYEADVDMTSRCAFPNPSGSPLDAWDPQCITVETTTTTIMNRPAQPSFLFDQLNTARQIWGRWFGDLARSWWVILLCAVGIALVLGFVWITFVKYFTACMVWSTIILTLLLVSCLTGYFYYRGGLITYEIPESWAEKMSKITESTNIYVPYSSTETLLQDWEGEGDTNTKAYRIMAYISTAAVFILLAIVVAIRNSIKKAVAVIRLGSDALKALPMTLFFPITNTIALGVFLIWWVYVAASLATAGEITTTSITDSLRSGVAAFEEMYGVTVDPTSIDDVENAASQHSEMAVVEDVPVMNYLVIYHVFSLLWAVQFIQGVAALTIAGAVAGWYFSRKFVTNDPSINVITYKQSRFPIFSSLRRTLFNHLGTVAFGSFLIALIQFIRAIAAYITKKMKPAARQNALVRFLLCCVHCFLRCLQAIVEIVTRNAYIFTAVKGDSFLRAGRRVFSLISNHGKTFVVVNVLGEIIMFLGKLVVSAASAFAAYLIFNHYEDFQPGGNNQLSSTWLPVLVTLFFAYAVSSGFMMIFDLAVDTVLVCYCTDIDENVQRHNGDRKYAFPIHADPNFLKIQDRLDSKKEKKNKKNKKNKKTNPVVSHAPNIQPSPLAQQSYGGGGPMMHHGPVV